MRRKIIFQLVGFWLVFLGFTHLVSAEHLPVKIYTSADGLGSSFVDDLMLDSRGFMWFCTRDGLSRFDGARFVTYQIGDKNSPPGIEVINETSNGVYWITTTGGLYRFKADAVPRTGQASGDRPSLNAEFVGATRGVVLEDRRGNLWYAGDKLYLLHERNGKVEFDDAHLNLPTSPNFNLTLYQFREAPDGCLWLNTSLGVVRRLPDGRVFLYRHENDVRPGVISLTIGADGHVWVMWGDELYVIQPAPIESLSSIGAYAEEPLAPTSISSTEPDREIRLPVTANEVMRLRQNYPNSPIRRSYRSRDGHIWLSSGRELREFDGSVFHSYSAAQGLPTSMAGMAEDSAGNLWVGGQAGLLRLDRHGLTTYAEGDGLNSARLYAITEAADGSLYFANGDFYLSRFDGRNFQTTRPALDPDARTLWSSRYAFLSRANEWWILTATKLYRFAASNLKKPLATYTSHDGFKANEMFQIFEDSHDDIWLSQQPSKDEDYGLYRLKKGEAKFYGFSRTEGLPVGEAASSFAEDPHGNLWIGFYEGGLVRFANNRFTEFTAKDGVPAGLITDLHVDRKGRLWLSSSIGGVSRLDDPGADKPIFIPLTTDSGLSSNNTRTITEDKFGDIYIGTVRGVDRISPDQTHIKHYSVSDGLAGDFLVDSHCDKNGVLWFATTNGLSRLVPTSDGNGAAPTIWLGGLRIAGEEQSVSELGDVEIQKGELADTHNNLEIEFFGLDLRAGEVLRYQFMLEGADSTWRPPTEQRTVTYANLKPGSYRFLVRAVNSDGVASVKPAVVSFRILSPIWLRWWFVALISLVVLALLYLVYRYRLAHLHEVNAALAEAKRAEEDLGKAREERLAELERVRIRIATDLHDDIGASLTQIAILTEVARQQNTKSNNASVEPLTSIARVSNELVETMSDIVWAINPRKDRLQDLIQRMRRFASDILSAKGISLAFNAPTYAPEIPLGANPRREVFLIFKESLTNIVKHANATQVRIEFNFSREYLTLEIADNGEGFDSDKISAALFAEQKGGHGVFSMKKRAAEMNGEFEIKSAAGKGTLVTFRLPIDSGSPQTRAPTTRLGGDIERAGVLD